MIGFCFELRTMILTVLALLAFATIDPSPRTAVAAEAKKSPWQFEWEKTLEAAKKEG